MAFTQNQPAADPAQRRLRCWLIMGQGAPVECCSERFELFDLSITGKRIIEAYRHCTAVHVITKQKSELISSLAAPL